MSRNSIPRRVEPDIPGHGLNILGTAQDMLKIGVLPQLLAFVPPKSSARLDFEAFHQSEEIAGFVEALEQKVAVVGHDAVGRDGEVFCCGFGLDGLQKPTTSRGVCKRFAALEAAQCDEVEAATTIVCRRQARVFALGKWHYGIYDAIVSQAKSGPPQKAGPTGAREDAEVGVKSGPPRKAGPTNASIRVGW